MVVRGLKSTATFVGRSATGPGPPGTCPPRCGGATHERRRGLQSTVQRRVRDCMFKIVDEPIDATRLGELVRSDADGAVCVFLGVARKFSRGREVVHLEYEAYPEMAEKVMSEIGDEMKARWPVSGVAIVHRTGVLEIGQASVVIAVAAPHRGEAFAASQYAIDRLKQVVPIWKKEVWDDGSQWIGWEHQSQGSGVSGG